MGHLLAITSDQLRVPNLAKPWLPSRKRWQATSRQTHADPDCRRTIRISEYGTTKRRQQQCEYNNLQNSYHNLQQYAVTILDQYEIVNYFITVYCRVLNCKNIIIIYLIVNSDPKKGINTCTRMLQTLSFTNRNYPYFQFAAYRIKNTPYSWSRQNRYHRRSSMIKPT